MKNKALEELQEKVDNSDGEKERLLEQIRELEYQNKDLKKAADKAREEVTKMKLAIGLGRGLNRGLTGTSNEL